MSIHVGIHGCQGTQGHRHWQVKGTYWRMIQSLMMLMYQPDPELDDHKEKSHLMLLTQHH